MHNIDRSPPGELTDSNDVAGRGVAVIEFLQSTSAQAVIWGTVLLILCVFAAYVAMYFRNRGGGTNLSASELLANFRQLHSRGGISQTEFREIKSVLGEKFQDELDSSHAERED